MYFINVFTPLYYDSSRWIAGRTGEVLIGHVMPIARQGRPLRTPAMAQAWLSIDSTKFLQDISLEKHTLFEIRFQNTRDCTMNCRGELSEQGIVLQRLNSSIWKCPSKFLAYCGRNFFSSQNKVIILYASQSQDTRASCN